MIVIIITKNSCEGLFMRARARVCANLIQHVNARLFIRRRRSSTSSRPDPATVVRPNSSGAVRFPSPSRGRVCRDRRVGRPARARESNDHVGGTRRAFRFTPSRENPSETSPRTGVASFFRAGVLQKPSGLPRRVTGDSFCPRTRAR